MKKIILFFGLLFVCTLSSWAQTSNLVVFSEDLNPFYLVVNGIKQNATAQTNVKVTDLKTTDNAVMVIFEDKALGTVKQNLYFTDMEVEWNKTTSDQYQNRSVFFSPFVSGDSKTLRFWY